MRETHVRYRKFNTKDTYPNQSLDNDLCQVVRARGTMIFVRGQVGQDIDNFESIESMSAYDQADRAMQNISQLLKEAGSELAHICRIQVYITDREYRDDVYQAIGKWLKGVYPVSTGLVVSGLARPEWVMEIEATAVLPDGPRSNK
jgi:enamine deaminase RidA (YjgF/YER057c/UK114 family)